jgi:hypothetical protein
MHACIHAYIHIHMHTYAHICAESIVSAFALGVFPSVEAACGKVGPRVGAGMLFEVYVCMYVCMSVCIYRGFGVFASVEAARKSGSTNRDRYTF